MSQEDFDFPRCEPEFLESDSDESEPEFGTDFSFDHDQQVSSSTLLHFHSTCIGTVLLLHCGTTPMPLVLQFSKLLYATNILD